jgi:hypothetical protein
VTRPLDAVPTDDTPDDESADTRRPCPGDGVHRWSFSDPGRVTCACGELSLEVSYRLGDDGAGWAVRLVNTPRYLGPTETPDPRHDDFVLAPESESESEEGVW